MCYEWQGIHRVWLVDFPCESFTCYCLCCAACMQAQPKRLGNLILTGPMLAGLVEAYVTAINNGAVPTIATAWQVSWERGSRVRS